MGRPWRVVGADASRVGAGGGGGGFRRLLDLAADGALFLGPRLHGCCPVAAQPVKASLGPWECRDPFKVSEGSWWPKSEVFLGSGFWRGRGAAVFWEQGPGSAV